MGAISPTSKNELTKEQNSRGGKTSKRGPSIKTRFEKILQAKLPASVKKAVEGKSIIQQGKYYKLNKKIFADNTGDALAMSIINEALGGEGWAAKLVTEMIDGKAKESVELSGGLDITTNDEASKEFINKHGLAKRT